MPVIDSLGDDFLNYVKDDMTITVKLVHLGLEDAKDEMISLEELEQAKKEIDKANGVKPMKQNMFKAI